MTKKPLNERLFEFLGRIETKEGVPNPEKKSNTGSYLYQIYIWQVIRKYADQKLTAAWNSAQDQGIVPKDVQLRELPIAENIVVESDYFTCVVKVDPGMRVFDKEGFIAEVSRKFKIKESQLNALAESSYKKSARKLTKRVIEA